MNVYDLEQPSPACFSATPSGSKPEAEMEQKEDRDQVPHLPPAGTLQKDRGT